MKYIYDDGGRMAAGFIGRAGDCVVRSVAIASGRPYHEVYAALSAGCRDQRVTKSGRRKASARDGVMTNRKWFKDYMTGLGFGWTATMTVGSGCKVHLRDGELPDGRLVASVSKHYVAVIDGVVHDTHDPTRNETRCVYGYWTLAQDTSSAAGDRQ